METLLEHPDLPFSIERNPLNNQYIKRYDNGAAQAATETEYLLALIIAKLVPNTAPVEAQTVATTEDKKPSDDAVEKHQSKQSKSGK